MCWLAHLKCNILFFDPVRSNQNLSFCLYRPKIEGTEKWDTLGGVACHYILTGLTNESTKIVWWWQSNHTVMRENWDTAVPKFKQSRPSLGWCSVKNQVAVQWSSGFGSHFHPWPLLFLPSPVSHSEGRSSKCCAVTWVWAAALWIEGL